METGVEHDDSKGENVAGVWRKAEKEREREGEREREREGKGKRRDEETTLCAMLNTYKSVQHY